MHLHKNSDGDSAKYVKYLVIIYGQLSILMNNDCSHTIISFAGDTAMCVALFCGGGDLQA